MKNVINSTAKTLAKIANIDNRIMILQPKSEKSFNELKNHIENTPLTRSQLTEISKVLNTIKAENEQMLSDNKELRDLLAVHQSK